MRSSTQKMAQATSEFDPQKRVALLQEATRIAMNDVAVDSAVLAEGVLGLEGERHLYGQSRRRPDGDPCGNCSMTSQATLPSVASTAHAVEVLADDIVVHRNVMVRMRDGVHLATDVYRPAVDGRPVETPCL